MKAWQTHMIGTQLVSYAYDEHGYTGEYGYVTGYGQKPDHIYQSGKGVCTGTEPDSVCHPDFNWTEYCEKELLEVLPWEERIPGPQSLREYCRKIQYSGDEWDHAFLELIIAPTYVILSGLELQMIEAETAFMEAELQKHIEHYKELAEQQIQEQGYVSLQTVPPGCVEGVQVAFCEECRN